MSVYLKLTNDAQLAILVETGYLNLQVLYFLIIYFLTFNLIISLLILNTIISRYILTKVIINL